METVDDILASGKPWKMVVYGDLFEHNVLKRFPKIWVGKEITPYNDFPFETVLNPKKPFIFIIGMRMYRGMFLVVDRGVQ